MLVLEGKNKCCGCRACEQICPKRCISMTEDTEGFVYPHINIDNCINCGLCEKTCPILDENKKDVKITLNNAYAAFNIDYKTVKESASGGIFSIFAKSILDEEGIVCGCAFINDIEAKHIIIDNVDDLYKLRGVKYIQSNINDVYTKIKFHLKENKKVLFSGTPCQVAGLKQFLKVSNTRSENLFTIDIICHGVPSQKIFNEYIDSLEKKNDVKINSFNFRAKSKGKWGHIFSYKFNYRGKEKTKILSGNLSPYYYGFLNNILSRPICYECKYSSLEREGDITIGDFWGVEKYHKNIESKYGISALIINSEKGLDMFEKNKNKMKVEKTTIDNVKARNSNLVRPSSKSKYRDAFFDENSKVGFDEAAKKYLKPKHILLAWIKSKIPFKVKEYIKGKI